ncbi:MAG: hypothetical protein AAB425_01235, partial [Bdellovibrionota bacterium]
MGIVLSLLLAAQAVAHALEMYAFTNRGPELRDSASVIDAEFNRRIALAVDAGNRGIASGKYKPCLAQDSYHAGYQPPQYPSSIYDPLVDILTRDDRLGYWTGGMAGTEAIEDWLEGSPEIDRVLVSGADSIYRDVAFGEQKIFASALWAGYGMSSLIRVGDHRIGIDKISHMASLGYTLFTKQRTSHLSSETDYFASASAESGTYGTDVSGIFSHADMAANSAGIQFWKDVFFGTEPIVSCRSGKLVKSRDFKIADYVTLAWDEAYNCNRYDSSKSPSVAASVAGKLRELGLSCPLSKLKCEEMK